jgi:hypothetical protein
MMEEPPLSEAPAPAPAPAQSWVQTERGPVPTPAMMRAIQADVAARNAEAAWNDDPANRPTRNPPKRRGADNPLKKRGRDDREVEELDAKLRDMKALRERVVEHIALCKQHGYCGYARDGEDPPSDAPQSLPAPDAPQPPPREPLPPSPPNAPRVGDQFQADMPD